MRCKTRCTKLTKKGWVGLALTFCAIGALATVVTVTSTSGNIDDPAVFELEGNAVTDLGHGGDDWDNVNSNKGNAAIIDRTLVVPDFGPNDPGFKKGSSKDISGINPSATKGWSWAPLGSPDKDDLDNAYAAAYAVHNNTTGNDELWTYFGTD